MNALVVYDSQYGNTERVAQAIADALRAVGHARAARADTLTPLALDQLDLLVIGCPTHGWNATPATHAFVDQVPAEQWHNLAVACFDTRFPLPRWMTGSAAHVIGAKLQALGIRLLVPPESFFIRGKRGPLPADELNRAVGWARMLLTTFAAAHPMTHA